MWVLTVLLQGEATPSLLHYTAIERARAAEVTATGEPDIGQRSALINFSPRVVLSDDFGRTLTFDRAALLKVLFQDAAKALEADRQMNLLQARSQAQLQEMALEDPVIRKAQARATSGLAVPGGRFQQ